MHRFAANGDLKSSWGEPGKDAPNEFHLVHSRWWAPTVCCMSVIARTTGYRFSTPTASTRACDGCTTSHDISQDDNGVFCISEGGRDARQGWTEETDSRISLMNSSGELLARWIIRGGHGSWIAPSGDIFVGVPDGVGVDKYVKQ